VLYPPELRGHTLYQLVTKLFFSFRVKLCLFVSIRSAIMTSKQSADWRVATSTKTFGMVGLLLLVAAPENVFVGAC
jgi:hypothetical protein